MTKQTKIKGLGRGLDAIFGTDLPTVSKHKPMAEMAEIDITDIAPNPTQPRRDFDSEALTELAASIKQLGVIQPITVKRDGSKYVIISGERRWRASQVAGLSTLPAYIREVDQEDLHAMALVENIQRQDLNAIEIALGMQRLVEECNLTQEALAERIGKKRSTISNYMRLLALPETVQLALKEGVISMGHAKAIAGVDPSKQLGLLRRCIKKSLSVRQVEQLAQALNQPSEVAPTPAIEEEYPDSYLKLVENLERVFSQDISIKRSKSGGGKIVIEFENDDQIDQFITRFNRR